ncbi:MAG: type III-B CRISPR module RAMP protein Cmr1 [Ignavibacteria bacterium]|nr:type III-B CRISPR module RAMP protein Cmr1 [Ignavibacteria bacterium]
MKKLTLTCKLITPMFMAGADSSTPELRASEFKGMMRWWWRAMKAEDNIQVLKSAEQKIFGGTEEGTGKSKVTLRILSPKISIGQNIGSELANLEGIKYLYYSTFLLQSRGNRIFRSYFKPKPIQETKNSSDCTQFTIELTAFHEGINVFKHFVASLWLSIYLGGFGTRARRGGGNLEITSCNGDNCDIDFICNAKNIDELKNWMQTNLSKIKNIINQSSNGTNKYTNLSNQVILIFEPKNNWVSALDFVGLRFREFRHNHKEDIFRTPAFGMPIMHGKFKVRLVPYIARRPNQRLSERWASPLIIKVIKSLYEDYYPVVIKLTPGGINFIAKETKNNNNEWRISDRDNDIQKFNAKILDDFLNELKENTNCKEIPDGQT